MHLAEDRQQAQALQPLFGPPLAQCQLRLHWLPGMAQTIPQTRRVERTGATESVHIPNVAPMLGFASVKKSYGTVPVSGTG